LSSFFWSNVALQARGFRVAWERRLAAILPPECVLHKKSFQKKSLELSKKPQPLAYQPHFAITNRTPPPPATRLPSAPQAVKPGAVEDHRRRRPRTHHLQGALAITVSTP